MVSLWVPGGLVVFGSWMVYPEDSLEIAQPVLLMPLDALIDLYECCCRSRCTLLVKRSSFLFSSGKAHGAGRGLSGGGELNA